MENNRYKFYRLGQGAESDKDFDKAKEHYLSYSSYLKEKDKHIPFIWIHDILFNQEKYDEAKEYLLKFCKGCSFPYASNILKEKMQLYKAVSQIAISNLLKKTSKEYQLKQIELLKQGT